MVRVSSIETSIVKRELRLGKGGGALVADADEDLDEDEDLDVGSCCCCWELPSLLPTVRHLSKII